MSTSPELVASYDVLRHVAYADHMLATEEKRALEVAASAIGAKAQVKPPKGTIVEAAAKVGDPALRKLTYAAAIAMANADGYCSTGEKEMLDALAKSYGLAPAELVAGCAREATPALLAAKEAATEKMLHEMAAAMESGALSQQRYEQLVAEMEAAMVRALG